MTGLEGIESWTDLVKYNSIKIGSMLTFNNYSVKNYDMIFTYHIVLPILLLN